MDTEVHTTLRDMLRRYRLTAIYVFGSRAAEIAARVAGAPMQSGGATPAGHPNLDVDIGVQPTRHTRPSAEVVRGELLVCADPDEEAESQLYYLRRAGDLAPFYREQLHNLLGTAP